MRIWFSDDCAWLDDGYEPHPDERDCLALFTEALPEVPRLILTPHGDFYLRALYTSERVPVVEYGFRPDFHYPKEYASCTSSSSAC